MQESGLASRQEFPAILVVNEDATIRNALRVVFHGAGYFVWEVGTLTDAVQIAEHIRFDLVFVDKVGLSFAEQRTIDALQLAHPQVQFLLPNGFLRRLVSRAEVGFEKLLIRGKALRRRCNSASFVNRRTSLCL